MFLNPRRVLFVGVCTVLSIGASASAEEETGPETGSEPQAEPTTEDTTLLDQVVPVAPDGAPDADDALAGGGMDDELATVPEADDAATEQTDEERLVEAFERYKELVSQGILDEADNVAKQVVELAIRTNGPTSSETAKALTNLAIVQHKNREYVAAQQNFQQAVDIIEDQEDRLTGALVNPLKGLGASQLESGRPDLAARTLGRAVHISHVNEGPHNVEQIELLEVLAESNLRMGEVDAAKDLYDTIYSINSRAYAGNELGMVPSLMRRAAWQHRAGYINDERATYRRIVRIIETRVGKDDLALIEPLKLLGRSYFFVDLTGDTSIAGSTATTGEIYFKRALRIAEENPDSTWRVKADTKLALADYYMFGGSLSRARVSYRDTWEFLSQDEERIARRDETLGRIAPLRENALPRYVGEARPSLGPNANQDLLEGSLTYTYAVTERGRVSDLKIVEAQPREFESIQNAVQREMRNRLYRPRFEDGEPVETSNLGNTHTFFYRQEDLDLLRQESKPAQEDGAGSDAQNLAGTR